VPRPPSPVFTPDHIRSWSSPPDSYVSKASTIGLQWTQPLPTPHDDNDERDLLNGKIRPHIYHRRHNHVQVRREQDIESEQYIKSEEEVKSEEDMKMEQDVKPDQGVKMGGRSPVLPYYVD
jgi:hypothetical protein